MKVLFIDPGTTRSAWILWDTSEHYGGCLEMAIEDNETVLGRVLYCDEIEHLVVEEIQSYGMPVGREVFETVMWCGRFVQARPSSWELYPRRRVKVRLCGSSKAKDANVRQAIIDLMGPAPTKKKPNPRWPSKPKKDLWAAAGLALAWMDRERERKAMLSRRYSMDPKRVAELASVF